MLVGVTTNEDLERLHPAVVRPGRCLARIEVGSLTRAESVYWLGTEEGLGREGATLAELYALRRGSGPASVPKQDAGADAGLYLSCACARLWRHFRRPCEAGPDAWPGPARYRV